MAANSNRQPVSKVLAFEDRYLFLCANQANGAEPCLIAPLRHQPATVGSEKHCQEAGSILAPTAIGMNVAVPSAINSAVVAVVGMSDDYSSARSSAARPIHSTRADVCTGIDSAQSDESTEQQHRDDYGFHC